MRRSHKAHRRLGLAAVGLVVAPLLVASAAYACTSLANLQANPGSGLAGATITVTGSNFRDTATSGPVEIRLDSRSGPVIASLATSQINPVGRTISVAVPISTDAALGFHTLLATQRDTSTGALLSGFPVRASYMVNGPAARVSSTAATVAPNAAATTPAASAASAASADPVAPNSPASDPVPAQLVARSAGPVVPKISAPSDQPVLQPTAPAGASPAAPLTGPATPMAAAPVPAAAPAPASPVAAASASPSLTTETSSSGLIPTAASASSSLPGFALLAAVAIVLLSLVASLRSGRSVLVRRRFGTLA